MIEKYFQILNAHKLTLKLR